MPGLLDILGGNFGTDDPRQAAYLALASGLLGGKGSFNSVLGQAMRGAQDTLQSAKKEQRQAEFSKMQMEEMQRKAEEAKRLQALNQQAIASFPQAGIVQGPPTEQGEYPTRQPSRDDFLQWAVKNNGADVAKFGFGAVERLDNREDAQKARIEGQTATAQAALERAREAQQAALERQREAQAAAAERAREHDKTLTALRSMGRTATPFFQPVPTTQGMMTFDARNGTFKPAEIGGKPLVKPTDSPDVQGRIAEEKELGKQMGEQRSLLKGKEDALSSVRDAKKLLDSGIYTGAYANLKKQGAKLAPFVDTAKADRTETFLSHIGQVVIPRLKEFGGNDSNEELKYLQKVMGGEITLEEGALKTIVADTERKIQEGIARLKARQTSGAPSGGPTVSNW